MANRRKRLETHNGPAMEKHLKTLLAALATISGASTEEITAKLTGDDADTADITSELAAVLTTHKDKVKTQKATDNSDGYKKAQREVLSKLEGEAKTKYGVSTDKTGLELIDEIVSAKTAEPGSVSEEVVKKHPAYLAMEGSVTAKVTEATRDATAKLTELEKGYKRRDEFEKVKGQALTEFDKLNPVLPTDAGAAQKRRDRFVKDLEQGTNFELTAAGEVLLLKADGTGRAEDAHGNPVKFSDHVKGIADELGFEYKLTSDRSSAGNDNSSQKLNGIASKFKGTLPAKGDENAYMNILVDAALDTAAKQEVKEYWAELNK